MEEIAGCLFFRERSISFLAPEGPHAYICSGLSLVSENDYIPRLLKKDSLRRRSVWKGKKEKDFNLMTL